MHSSIYQVSIQPIEVDDYAKPDYFYDNSNDFADYIGEEWTGDNRKEDIKWLAHTLSDLFDLDETGEILVYKGGMDVFKEKWTAAIHKAAEEVTDDNVLESMPRWYAKNVCEKTHLYSDYRFSIENWNDYPNPLDELIEYVADKMKPGDKLYIGAVIDFHF